MTLKFKMFFLHKTKQLVLIAEIYDFIKFHFVVIFVEEGVISLRTQLQ